MKKIILLSIISFFGYSQETFGDGYKVGYKEGYCFEKTIGCITPLAPMSPMAPIGKDTYKDAYKYQSGGKAESEMLDKAIEQGQADGQALGNAIAIAMREANKKKLAKYSFLYEQEPSIQNAFELSKASMFLNSEYGPISDKHKLLVIKYKGKYRRYLKAVKKGKEKPE